jgi:hypothetical protein
MTLFTPTRAGWAGCLAAVLLSVPVRDAAACGGCFHPYNAQPEESSVVTGHRMALAISPTETVLWDQISYAGSPSDFAWVLPVRRGAYLELSNDAWFDTLDAATATRVSQPRLDCSSSFAFDDDYPQWGCGARYAAGCAAR